MLLRASRTHQYQSRLMQPINMQSRLRRPTSLPTPNLGMEGVFLRSVHLCIIAVLRSSNHKHMIKDQGCHILSLLCAFKLHQLDNHSLCYST